MQPGAAHPAANSSRKGETGGEGAGGDCLLMFAFPRDGSQVLEEDSPE